MKTKINSLNYHVDKLIVNDVILASLFYYFLGFNGALTSF